MPVGSVAALLRHRALGLANDGGFPVRGNMIADAEFGAARQTLNDWPPGFALSLTAALQEVFSEQSRTPAAAARSRQLSYDGSVANMAAPYLLVADAR